jgi:hypothetical protein
MAPATSPVWKQLFDAVDQRVSPTINEFAKREEVASLAALGLRGRSEVHRAIERVSRRALHLLNLPAGSDVNRLLEHIARVEQEVRGLRQLLADRENADYLAALEAGRSQKEPERPHKQHQRPRSTPKQSR